MRSTDRARRTTSDSRTLPPGAGASHSLNSPNAPSKSSAIGFAAREHRCSAGSTTAYVSPSHIITILESLPLSARPGSVRSIRRLGPQLSHRTRVRPSQGREESYRQSRPLVPAAVTAQLVTIYEVAIGRYRMVSPFDAAQHLSQLVAKRRGILLRTGIAPDSDRARCTYNPSHHHCPSAHRGSHLIRASVQLCMYLVRTACLSGQ